MQRGNKSNEDEISLCFQIAIKKLDKIDADAKKEKTQIVQDLAKDLEGKIPMDRIAIEIVHQLHRKVSERLIHDCLDEKYKQKHRVENAKKQKRREIPEDLAAPMPLNSMNVEHHKKEVVIDTLGNEIVEPQIPTSEVPDYEDEGNKVTLQQSPQRDLTECEDCEVKECRIKDLEDALRKATQLTPTDQMTPKETAEQQVIEFHFSMPFEDLRSSMGKVFEMTKGFGKVMFRGTLNTITGEVTVFFCGNSQDEAFGAKGKGSILQSNTPR
jgi:hypothetical protein